MEKTMVELAACPFCGEQPVTCEFTDYDDLNFEYERWGVRCQDCGDVRFEGPASKRAETIKRWNARPSASAPQAGVREALEKIACRHVTDKPLWWQLEARTALDATPTVQAPEGMREALQPFLAHADKQGDTSSDDRWHRGAGWAWREAAKMVRAALAASPRSPLEER